MVDGSNQWEWLGLAHRAMRREARLHWSARILAGELLSFYGVRNPTGPVFRTIKQLRESLGLLEGSEATVTRGLEQLDELRLFVFEPRRKGEAIKARYVGPHAPVNLKDATVKMTDEPVNLKDAYKNDEDENSISLDGEELPNNWTPGEVGIQYALSLDGMSSSDVDRCREDFVDHFLTVPGPQMRQRDWLARWRRWAREYRDKLVAKRQRSQRQRGNHDVENLSATSSSDRGGYGDFAASKLRAAGR
jgi:hypothetical protein